MRKIITLIILCVAAVVASAQNKADIIVSYEYLYPSMNGKLGKSTMTLLASATESKYFNDLSLWTDSLKSTPGGKAKLMEIIKKACMTEGPDGSISVDLRKGPVKKVYTYVFNDVNKGELSFFGKWGEDLGYYTEPLTEIKWLIVGDSIVNLMGYDCVLAETDYHGRHWKAWFAPEIPVPFGPWKLQGLPGLILKADANGGFGFTATGFESTDREITPMYLANEYSKVDRLKALADEEHYRNNMESMMNAGGGGKVKIRHYDDDGNEVEAPVFDGKKHSLEPDYKK